MDWSMLAFWGAIIDFVILVVMGLVFGSRFKALRKEQFEYYEELRGDINEATGEGFIERAHRRKRI